MGYIKRNFPIACIALDLSALRWIYLYKYIQVLKKSNMSFLASIDTFKHYNIWESNSTIN